MEKIRPTGITADRTQRILTITWSDGQAGHYPFAGLRAICPCVTCKGGHDNMGGPPDVDVLYVTKNEGVTIESIHTVGSYALQIVWSDGHDTGIYTWDYLRQARA
ncbi:MAG: DUF971 domain-containing protein [Anaerolinea sp.]|nr:DUF971 domain-containing protein [Anaerolinea sp.]